MKTQNQSNIIQTTFNSEKGKLEVLVKKVRGVKIREQILTDSGIAELYQNSIQIELVSEPILKIGK